MKKQFIIYLLAFIWVSCSSNPRYGYWSISDFTLVPGALKDGEEMKVIYTYRVPTGGANNDWYNHVIVVSQKTGDTVNVLEIGYPVDEYDKDRIFNFLGPENIATKMEGMEPDEMAKITHVDQWDTVQIKKRPHVCRDKKFDNIRYNKFPTVIGSIGTVTKLDTYKINSKINEIIKP